MRVTGDVVELETVPQTTTFCYDFGIIWRNSPPLLTEYCKVLSEEFGRSCMVVVTWRAR